VLLVLFILRRSLRMRSSDSHRLSPIERLAGKEIHFTQNGPDLQVELAAGLCDLPRGEVTARCQSTATAVGAACRLYSLQCSEATARARCRLRNANLQGSLYIADNTFNVLQSRFEPLQPDEPHVLINTES